MNVVNFIGRINNSVLFNKPEKLPIRISDFVHHPIWSTSLSNALFRKNFFRKICNKNGRNTVLLIVRLDAWAKRRCEINKFC